MFPQVIKNLEKKNKVFSTKELNNLGITHYAINKLIEDGLIERLKRGVYIVYNSNLSDSQVVQELIPSGVFCLHSAAMIYNYGTHVPYEFHIAIESKENYTLPNYPPVKLYYWKKAQYELGVESITYDSYKVRVYDREKTVCDFIKFRKKQERTVVNQILRSYLNDNDRNLNKLNHYAQELGIKTVLSRYLEVLL